MAHETAIGGPVEDFPRTRWTRIAAAREGPEARRRALEELLGVYWRPLYACARRKGLSVDGAKDAVQGLFARLLERDFLAGLDPGRGPLRAFLKTALQNLIINEHESAAALKRGGDRLIVPLDFEAAERGLEPAGDAFDREWAVGVMERVIARLRGEFERGERGGPFDLVLRFLSFGAAPSYEEAAEEHSMTVSQLKAFLHRARARFREIAREEVADTVSDPGEVDAEIGHLLRALSS